MTNDTVPPVLKQAYVIQDIARRVMVQREQGIEPDEQVMAEWMQVRRNLAGAEITSPVEGIAVAHQLIQAVSALPRFSEDPDALNYMAAEIGVAAVGLLRFFEEHSGVTREALGLYDDYCGPTRN